MTLDLRLAILISALSVGLSATASAQQASPPAGKSDLGKYEYETACAVCHGLSGKGDGPFSSYMQKSIVTDLTAIAKKNNGVFPVSQVYEIIDGTKLVAAHGNRDMPIWGDRYKVEATKQLSYYPYLDADVFVHGRILALTEYIYRLQVR